MDGDPSALPPSAALPPISSDPSSTEINNTLPASAPPPPGQAAMPMPMPAPQPIPAASIPPTLARHTSLLSPQLHSRILGLSDEFFAPAQNLISPSAPVRKPGLFVETGAWYDGWETRRHNTAECDWVVLALSSSPGEGGGEGGGGGGVRARVRAVEVDTFGFVGNHAEEVRVLGADEGRGGGDGDGRVMEVGYTGWREVLPRWTLRGGTRHAWLLIGDDGVEAGGGETAGGMMITHVKLQMFPDGGIARFRLYGDVVPDFPPVASLSAEEQNREIELSAALMGGAVVDRSDEHFGRASNLLLPGRGVDMGDGWETKRSRGVGHEDWVVVRLGARGTVRRCVVDTMHFRGNFPREVRVEGMDAGSGNGDGPEDLSLRQMQESDQGSGEGVERAETGMAGEGGFFERDEGTKAMKSHKEEEWRVLGAVKQCEKDKEHEIIFDEAMVCTHMKMVIIPDGGVKRFRVFGTRV